MLYCYMACRASFISFLFLLVVSTACRTNLTQADLVNPQLLPASVPQASAGDGTLFCDSQISPEFPGGMKALIKYIQRTISYPKAARQAGVTGRVFVSFIVELDGSLTGIQVLRGLGYGCDEEAVRVFKAMPRWKPGRQSGLPIRVRYNLPVLFGVDYPAVRKR